MIYRIDVKTTAPARGGAAAADPVGEALRHQIAEFGRNVGRISTARIFLIESDAEREQVERAAMEVLADPVVEQAEIVTAATDGDGRSRIEVHLKPGVMDPVAASTEMALRDLGLDVREVRTGRAFLIEGELPREELESIASKVLANGVIESIHFEPFIPRQFEAGREYKFELRHVRLRDLDDAQLQKLSREGHLFLSLEEMKSIQQYYREQNREPTDIELETLAQTWSEHCVHKTLKSAVEVYDESGKHLRSYKNLIKNTIFQSTQELMGREAQRHEGTKARSAEASGAFCLSVFKDNAGVIAFDDTDAVCFKVETHNHPSAIEPYGGSATGVGGVVRDILGTGLSARPVANTDVFCVAYPDAGSSIANRRSQIANLPKGVIHPKRILQQVVAGVRDYGNRMGIPTVNGAVYFDDRYIGNPLVFCGCVGIIPRDKIEKAARAGDAIVLVGGRTGRDGIHGATFSSAELTDTHADEFSHAVQIGNAITEKKVADVILQARDRDLFTAITDLGAGGLSSAVGEMGAEVGATVELETVPLKYAGLRYDEIWISEAQERMLLSVPREHVDALLQLAANENVEATVIGAFGTDRQELILNYRGTGVGRMAMQFLHEGIPMPARRAVVTTKDEGGRTKDEASSRDSSFIRHPSSMRERLLSLLSHPNIASKHWIIRQYDHEVQGGSLIKPLIGPMQIGPSDAAVIRPKLNSTKGVAIACGLAPHIDDPYAMAIAAIDEAIRNVISVGANPDKLALLDNFCWPSVDDEKTMGALVRACEACRDAALAYGTPFISGKDSLHNQFTNSETGEVIRIPNTLLISAIGVIDDVRRCITMDLKAPGNGIALVSAGGADLAAATTLHRTLADAIRHGLVASCHDISDGGTLTAAAEMCIASGLGLDFGFDYEQEVFAGINGYIVEFEQRNWKELDALMQSRDVAIDPRGQVVAAPRLRANVGRDETEWSIDELTSAWRGTLDW